MSAGQYDREAVTDTCACGRRKDKTEYVCSICYDRGHRERVSRESTHPKVVVIDGLGEFRDGAEFDGGEFGVIRLARHNHVSVLSLGYLPEGMIVSWRGRQYAVRGEQMQPQRLEAV